ncbi:N-acetylmuramoyl-L-alanine amidase [Streptomyces violaceorubidus]|uniref:N-acetylmuramoyl-L-alanine amidase n=1 Tax=Streptomyces violaceorubidus TaxID=284042 RepID=UPI0004BF9EEB|nr:peptidoglycan recognition family protein [Streptomyces violaceorubidus]
MATPLSASALLAALKAEGCQVVEYRDWRTHNRNHKGAWGPVHGVVIHHTVSSGEDSSVALCYDGHADLPGPLCHTVGGKSGKLYMVGHGRANHAGSGDGDVLQAVIDERALPADNEANTDGNARFYGIEIVNLGNGKDTYPAVQYDAAVRWAAAICRAHGWGAASVIGHKEWQPGKIDPAGPVEGRGDFSMDRFRADVGERLTHPASWSAGSSSTKPPAQEEDPMAGYSKADIGDAVIHRDNIPAPKSAPDKAKNTKWTLSSYVQSIYNTVVGLPGDVSALRKDVAALRADVAALKKES